MGTRGTSHEPTRTPPGTDSGRSARSLAGRDQLVWAWCHPSPVGRHHPP